MIKVAFFPPSNKEWMGGVNYYKNLLYAISTLDNKTIEPIVFIGKNADKDLKQIYSKYFQVVESSIFDRKSLYWLVDRLSGYWFLNKLLAHYHIDVLSHNVITNLKNYKVISWIPDFQHVHLPEMFNQKELDQRDSSFLKLARLSDRVLLSSYSALKDFKAFAPQYEYKAEVLQFVSQPEHEQYVISDKDITEKYNIQGEFFFLPNQFWKHKNHLLVFKAVRYLKNEGVNIRLVCSGFMTDYRNSDHLSTLIGYVDENNLKENISLLGSIPYSDVFQLMKGSIAVINPSLFEGWSSTVEECKSIGKEMILSDLDVHKEQYPNAAFFNKNDHLSLASKLTTMNSNQLRENAEVVSNLLARTEKFAKKYEELVVKTYKG